MYILYIMLGKSLNILPSVNGCAYIHTNDITLSTYICTYIGSPFFYCSK